jgi:hypothetical protein
MKFSARAVHGKAWTSLGCRFFHTTQEDHYAAAMPQSQ